MDYGKKSTFSDFLKIAGDQDIDMFGTSEINKINVRPKKSNLTSGST